MNRKWICLLALVCLLLAGIPVLADNGKHTPPSAAETETIYAIDQKNQTYHAVPESEWERIRAALTLPTQPMAENTAAKDLGGFCFVLQSGERKLYTVTDAQVLAGDAPLLASIFQRALLEQMSRELCGKYAAQPAMLAYMNRDKATAVTVKGFGGTNGRIDPEKPLDFTVTTATDRELVQDFVSAMKRVQVRPERTEFLSETPGPDSNDRTLYLGLAFNTGTRYDMTLAEEYLLIRSSDGVRTYRYPIDTASGSPIWEVRNDLWNGYTDDASCVAAGVFLTKTDSKERMAGAFYSAADGGDAPLARLSRVVDRILNAQPKPTIVPAGRTYVEVYAAFGDLRSRGVVRFELDESLNAYYVNDAGRGVCAAISREDWDTVRSLLNGERDTEKLMLTEKGEAFELLTLTGSEWFLEPLFSPLPKNPNYKPYNTGTKPDYAVDGIHCWKVRGGELTETTIYPEVLVQQSNLLPWTPADYDASPLYRLLNPN